MIHFNKKIWHSLAIFIGLVTVGRTFGYVVMKQTIHNQTPFSLNVTISNIDQNQHKNIAVAPYKTELINTMEVQCAQQITAEAITQSTESSIGIITLQNMLAQYAVPKNEECMSNEYTVKIKQLPSNQYQLLIVPGNEEQMPSEGPMHAPIQYGTHGHW